MRRRGKVVADRGAEVRGTAVVVLVVSHCCISTASVDHIGLSGDQQVNQKGIWTSGLLR